MKKVLLLVAVLVAGIASANAQSENYKAFKVDVGTLYAIPGAEEMASGLGFYIEPKYNMTDNLALGLKMEWAIMGAADEYDVDISALGTYQLTGDYYFGDSKVRPFVGLGAGIYAMGSVTASNTQMSIGGVTVDAGDLMVDEVMPEFGTKFGFAPRAGLLLGHFRLGLEYNIITGIDDVLPSRNYLSFKVGFEIGGGKK
ncbi:outer membrane beta-barrel protein [Carboxylicivirga mesophila]|uniref:Outer membrane beta-barrel protein n=1 Tax=Carboxylicivirga mesophila TaxID=1166478 RepID=A0ABS5K5T9_9BACT|nr:outer membrane beta-barrel protein [Carboxylicivirga mesophila]MBS2210350.1 outer membrane beta-barrel protein [Carboxylicivirga mesophila]